MYTIYHIENGKLQIMDKLTKDLTNVWIKVESPTAEELKELSLCLPVPDEVIKDTQDINEVPKLDRIGNLWFILLQTPTKESDGNDETAAYAVVPLGILMNEHVILTLTWSKNDVVTYLEEKLNNISQNQIVDTTKREQFLLKWFLFTAKVYLRYLKAIHTRLRIPSSTKHQHFDKDILDLLTVEESLVYFNASLRSNDVVIEKISKRKTLIPSEDVRELLDDARDETWQALEVAQVYSRIVEDLRNALSSLISNTLTRTVNWLTKVTVILMIPTLVATLYGMNVTLPFASHPHAFLVVVFITVVCTLSGIAWLNRQSHR